MTDSRRVADQKVHEEIIPSGRRPILVPPLTISFRHRLRDSELTHVIVHGETTTLAGTHTATREIAQSPTLNSVAPEISASITDSVIWAVVDDVITSVIAEHKNSEAGR